MVALSSSFIISCLPKQHRTNSTTSHQSPLLISSHMTTKQQTPKPTPTNAFFAAVENLINTSLDPPSSARPFLNPTHVLSGNFAPVDELPPTDCHIIGTLPPCLDGAYIRNGPNPQFYPRGPYHLFDGDGMLHCLRVSNRGARATLSSRYVCTTKHDLELRIGTKVVPDIFASFEGGLLASAARVALYIARSFAGHFSPFAIGLANTSIALIAGKLFALCECDLPYEVAITPEGDVLNLGRSNFNGQLSKTMTAHPKKDPVTRETFAFRYGLLPPFLTFFKFDETGRKIGPDVPIHSMHRLPIVHDFAITEKYAVFADIQIGMSPIGLVLRGGSPVVYDSKKVPRMCVLPRYAVDESEIRWFEVPGLNYMHVINAWDETDPVTGSEYVVLVAPNLLPVEDVLERLELVHGRVERVRIDLRSGNVFSRTLISSRSLEFAVINPNRVGRRNRFVYSGITNPTPLIAGVVKLDMEMEGMECAVAERMFGEGCFGGEPVFVARDVEDEEGEEDDGYLVVYVHNEKTGNSRFVVMDASSSELEVVAEVMLPQRVPYGFHGIFVREEDLNVEHVGNLVQPVINIAKHM